MMIDPVGASVATLEHSAPSLHWWLGLNAAEQSAWAAAFVGLLAAAGGFSAALASYFAAKAALDIARREDERQDALRARRGEVHAAYMINEIVVVFGLVERVRLSVMGIANAAEYVDMRRLAAQVHREAESWTEAINSVRPESIAELPDSCAAATAGAMSAARLASRLAHSIEANLDQNPVHVASQREVARVVEAHCMQIHKSFQPYLEYCRQKFGTAL